MKQQDPVPAEEKNGLLDDGPIEAADKSYGCED